MANRNLLFYVVTSTKHIFCSDSQSSNCSPPWNSLGAKLKRKSYPQVVGEQAEPSALRFVMRLASLPYHAELLLLLLLLRPYTKEGTAMESWEKKKKVKKTRLDQNRFSPLTQDPKYQFDLDLDQLSSQSRVRNERKCERKRPQEKLMTERYAARIPK